jgi:hypothetical protein
MKAFKKSLKPLRLNSGGYADGNEEGLQDTWSSNTFEGRADQPMEKESDGLTKYIESPKARAINHSLGLD